MNRIRSIIIDDEPDGRDAIRIALEKYCPDIEIVAICNGPEVAIPTVKKLKPDLVFLDIQMPILSGFDLLKQLSPVDFEVIFLTAFDQYAIKAIKFSALDYLLKPIDVDDLLKAMERAKERIAHKTGKYGYSAMLNNIRYQSGRIEKIAVPTLEGINFFNIEDIIYCESEGSYTRLILINNKTELVSRHLKEFEEMLVPSGFCRIHHSFMVNLKHVLQYFKGEGGHVLLTGGYHLAVSRRKKDGFLLLLNKI